MHVACVGSKAHCELMTLCYVILPPKRKQCVKIGQNFSQMLEIYKGVPQGSILGPVLFNIFINDIFLFVKHCDLYNYADDNTLSKSGHSLATVIKSLEDDSASLISWFSVSSIWVRTKPHLWWCCAVVLPEVTSVTWPKAPPTGSMFCACATGSCAISGCFHRKWHQSRDRERACPGWTEVALTGSLSGSVRMRNRKLRNIRPSRAFWPEVTSSNVTWPFGVHLEGWGARMRNRKMRNIRRSRPFSPEVTSSNFTWSLWGSLGRVGCAHAQPEVAQYPT